MKTHSRGFALIELAIVIIVIGLVIGGVIVGRDVMRNAELQSILVDMDTYKKAAQTFRDKYKALPGDMANAESIWGAAASCPPPPSADHTEGYESGGVIVSLTCNGDGDSFIGGSDGTPQIIGTDYKESILLWQHLANAQLVKWGYTGAEADSPYNNKLEPGFNIPASQVEGTGFTMFFAFPTYGNANFNDTKYRHIIVYGAPKPSANANYSTHWQGILGNEALLLDMKADDGRPHTGNVQTFTNSFDTGGSARCALAANAGYNTESDACPLIFITGY